MNANKALLNPPTNLNEWTQNKSERTPNEPPQKKTEMIYSIANLFNVI